MAGDAKALARVRMAYEAGRASRAARGALLLAATLIPALVLGARIASTFALGAAVMVAAFALLWRGRAWAECAMPGVLAGAVPLYLSMGAHECGHVCAGPACYSVCIPACVVGGFVAGGALSWLGRRALGPWRFLAVASGLAWLTGSLGCCCVGYGGMIGLLAGLLLGSGGVLAVRPFRGAQAA